MSPITIDERRAPHIFREAEGHLREDTPANRKALLDVAYPVYLVGTDRFGNSWFAEIRTDGTQVWAQVRDNKIVNGGINRTPQNFDRPRRQWTGKMDPIR